MINIAINGYGRIGRCVLRALYESPKPNIRIVAVNELADCKTIAYLTKYDSTHGKFQGEIDSDQDIMTVNGDAIKVIHEENIEPLPWRELGIDVVLECTGSFSDRATAEKHLAAGAKHVLFSQPAESDVDVTLVHGINSSLLSADHKIISNASCTTNCIIPVIDALDTAFGVDSGIITTIHSAMNDQPVIDAYHHTDLRKTRSSMQSIIPVDTGLAKGIDRILPSLAGRFEAKAIRVPTINVSTMDLAIVVKQTVNTDEVNSALKSMADRIPTILGYTEEPLASCDFNHDSRSGIVDATQTRVAGGHLIKVLTWFDNEWGFANRMLDVVDMLDSKRSP